jgi:hypothetical protein
MTDADDFRKQAEEARQMTARSLKQEDKAVAPSRGLDKARTTSRRECQTAGVIGGGAGGTSERAKNAGGLLWDPKIPSASQRPGWSEPAPEGLLGFWKVGRGPGNPRFLAEAGPVPESRSLHP